MTFLNRVSQALSTSWVDAGRTRARRALLERGDRFLADNGFSRELLEAGNDAWPWRVDGTASWVAPQLVLPPAGLRTPVPAALPYPSGECFGIACPDVAVARDDRSDRELHESDPDERIAA